MSDLCTHPVSLPESVAKARDLRTDAQRYRKLASTFWDERTRQLLETMATESESRAAEIEAEQSRRPLRSTPRSLEHV